MVGQLRGFSMGLEVYFFANDTEACHNVTCS
jgi:hypothetical protein